MKKIIKTILAVLNITYMCMASKITDKIGILFCSGIS